MGFADLDWASDPNSRRSVSGYTFMFCGAIVSWLAKKQPTIALLSTEAEYMVMTHAGKEAVFLEHLYSNVGIPILVLIFSIGQQPIHNCPCRKSHFPHPIQTY